ncbi:MAG: putative bifunctional diguanylate cyclase/phosphodiesterase [Acidobacteriota bacterium]
MDGARPVLLLVSGDPDFRGPGLERFDAAGFEAEGAADGAQGLSQFKLLKPAIVLIEVAGPGTDGLELCGKIRALPDGENTPLLLVSGSDRMDLVARAYELGATDFISKPINWLILKQRVSYLLRATWAFEECRRSQARLQKARRVAADASEQIERLVHFDSLTGLPNRLLFKEVVRQALARRRRSKRPVAVLYLDVNDFKEINETLGHGLGDGLLKQLAERLRITVRCSDYVARETKADARTAVARMGGDEFLIMLSELDCADHAVKVARRILDAMLSPFVGDENELFLSASIGIAVAPSDGEDVESLIQHAATAMYQGRRRGRGKYQFFAQSMHVAASKKLDLERGLRKAPDRGELYLCYQPMVSGQNRQLVGAEALLRWNHPKRGDLTPCEFIPVAEECGLMVPVGRWVLQTACRQARLWAANQGLTPMRVSVNVSLCQLREGGLVGTVREVLEETGLSGHLLELELSERGVLLADHATLSQLEALKLLGVRLTIDDFGAGQSVLAYLKKLPLDALKIDRSFIDGLPDDADNEAIVSAIIAMAHRLQLKVTAEGVETKEQASFLSANRCDELQGSFFGMPLPPAELRRVLAPIREKSEAHGGDAAIQ